MNRSIPLPLALALAACTSAPAPEPTPPPLVRSYRVTAASGRSIELRGQVAARSRVKLGFKQPGVVEAILVREGDRVAAGAIVARLDDVDAQALVRMARTARDKARRDAERAARLAKEGAMATSLRDDTQSQLESAEAELVRAEDLHKRTRLVSPVSGTVFLRTSEPGETVDAGSPIVILDTTGALEVEAGATLREAQNLRPGLAVFLVPEEGEAVPGRITSVASTPDPADGLYEVVVAPDKPASAWRPGSLLRVRIAAQQGGAALRIPLEALVHRQEKDYVFVLQGETAKIRPVVVGPAEARQIQIASGLETGDEIVAEGAYFLQDGQAVRVLR